MHVLYLAMSACEFPASLKCLCPHGAGLEVPGSEYELPMLCSPQASQCSCRAILHPLLTHTQASQCSALQALPLNPRHFLVGADGGRVLKGSWVGVAPAPKEYVVHSYDSAAALDGAGRSARGVPCCVTALHVSPVCPWAFLAGHDDGTVTLHSAALSAAVAVWPGVAAGGVRALRWSPARPCVFFVMDAMCMVSCFDLSKNMYVLPCHRGISGHPELRTFHSECIECAALLSVLLLVLPASMYL